MARTSPSAKPVGRRRRVGADKGAPGAHRVAVVQHPPVLLDLKKTTDRTIDLIAQCAAEGAKLATLRRRREWRTVQSFPSSFRFPDGESFLEMQARMVSTLDRLADRHRGETFVAVSHADPIKAAVAATAGVPLDLFQRLVVSPCSITGLVRGQSGSHVLCVNVTASLADLALS